MVERIVTTMDGTKTTPWWKDLSFSGLFSYMMKNAVSLNIVVASERNVQAYKETPYLYRCICLNVSIETIDFFN